MEGEVRTAKEEVGSGKEGSREEKEGRGRWWMTGGRRDGGGGVPARGWRWKVAAAAAALRLGRARRWEGKVKKEEKEVEEEYAAARKSRPIFQRGTIATERPGDHLKYLVAGRKLSGTGSR